MAHKISILTIIIINSMSTFSQKLMSYDTNTVIGQNLIVNGGFEDGDTGFDVPGYLSWNNGFMPQYSTPGQYYVSGNTKRFNSAFNGVPHSGNNHLMVDGLCTSGSIVWEQQITIEQNTNYYFEVFISSIHPITTTNLSFEINDEILPEKIIIHTTYGSWLSFVDSSWFSNTTEGEITLRIRNDQAINCTDGNDFALDDISFKAVKKVIKRLPDPELTVFGLLYDDSTKKTLSGDISFVMVPVDSIVGIVSTDTAKEYNQTLKGYKKYRYSIKKEGYKYLEDTLDFTELDISGKKRLDIFLTPTPLSEEELLTLKGIEFKTSKWDILPQFIPELEKAVIFLNKYKDYNYEVAGHTDSRDTDKRNQVLSQKRANAVKNYLITKGIKAERLTAVGYGEKKPTDTNTTEKRRQRNRRVELIKK